MISRHNIYSSIEASYDPFIEEKSNTNRIKALILVQDDVIREVLTDQQKDIVRLVILEEHTQKYTADLLGVSKFCILRELKKSINTLQKYLHFCDLALRRYESLQCED